MDKILLYVKNSSGGFTPLAGKTRTTLRKVLQNIFWGYDEKGSDAPPKGTASPGRINPDGISYLYAANDIQTAVLEVRPIPTSIC